jgi:hypothetical protein
MAGGVWVRKGMLPLVQCNITIKDQKNPRNLPKEFGRGVEIRPLVAMWKIVPTFPFGKNNHF